MMTIRQEDLLAVNEQIWSTMLGIPLVSMEIAEPPPSGDCMGACVQLVGAWQGAVLLDCSVPLAQRAARRFLGREQEAVTLEEIRDTVGELANMAAGGVKALLPQPTHISLPSVADGRDYDLTVRRGKVVLQCPFQSEGERLLVSLVERDTTLESLNMGCPLTERIQ